MFYPEEILFIELFTRR